MLELMYKLFTCLGGMLLTELTQAGLSVLFVDRCILGSGELELTVGFLATRVPNSVETVSMSLGWILGSCRGVLSVVGDWSILSVILTLGLLHLLSLGTPCL